MMVIDRQKQISKFIAAVFPGEPEKARSYLVSVVAEAVAFFDFNNNSLEIKKWLSTAGLNFKESSVEDIYMSIEAKDFHQNDLINLVADAPNLFADEEFFNADQQWKLMAGLSNLSESQKKPSYRGPEVNEMVSRMQSYLIDRFGMERTMAM